jgi:hypothetical protein
MKLSKHIYKLKAELLISGDINTDFLIEGDWGGGLDSLLIVYNLLCTVNFATRTQNDSC